MSTRLFLQQCMNLAMEFNSRQYQANLKELKEDEYIYDMFADRIKYFNLDKKKFVNKVKTTASNLDIKLGKVCEFDEEIFWDNYNSNNYYMFQIYEECIDFRMCIDMVKVLLAAKRTTNEKYLAIKAIVESKGGEFIKKGYPLDFYYHDYKILSHDESFADKVWLTKDAYISTHVMTKGAYKEFIKFTGGEFIVIDLANMKQI